MAAETAKEVATETEQAAVKARGYVLEIMDQLRASGQNLEVRAAAEPQEEAAPQDAQQSAPIDEVDALLGL